MSEKKKALIDLIEAYAASKSTQNETLQKMAIEKLSGFLQTIEVIPVNTQSSEASVVQPDQSNPAELM